MGQYRLAPYKMEITLATKILLLEDDKLFNETLQDFLEEEGFVLDCALDPYTALDLSYEHNYSLYLFDVNLPYENGFELLHKLRTSGDMTPAIFLTSRDDKNSLTKGFEVGGDDYMKKPIDLDELLLRIHAVLRRQVRKERMPVGDYMLDMVGKTLSINNKPVEMSQKAVELLILLVEAKGEVVCSDVIKNRLWTTSQYASDGSLRVYITQLKKYFPKAISNIRGIGYKWIEI